MPAYKAPPFRVTVAALLSPLLACSSDDVVLGPADWETVLWLPGIYAFQLTASPDGWLFAGTGDGLYRARADSPFAWTRLAGAGDVMTRLYVPSGSMVYWLERPCGTVYRWDEAEGRRMLRTPVSDSGWLEHGGVHCLGLNDVWGRAADDVFVVGDRATILHFDRASWTLESNPLLDTQNARGPPGLGGIGGRGTEALAGGARLLRRGMDGRWVEVRRNPDVVPVGCDFAAVAATDREALLGYNGCISRVDGDSVVLVRRYTTELRDGIYAGRAQLDGSALFWSYKGDVAEVNGTRIRLYHFHGIRAVGSALMHGSFLYVAGTIGDDGVIVRVRRR